MNKAKIKVCVLGASFNTGNMGVSALISGTIKSITHQFPDAEISLLDYGKEGVTYHDRIANKNISVELLNIRFSKKIYLRNNVALLILLSLIVRILPFRGLKNRLIERNPYLKQIVDSDIIASIAGGDSFSDIYGLGRFFYVSLPQLLVLFMGKELVHLPQTIGPFKGAIARSVARYILSRSYMIYSRDYTGIKELERFLGKQCDPEKVRFCYDMGFVLDPIKPSQMDLSGLETNSADSSCKVGLNVSGLLFAGGYTQNNMFGLKVGYRDLIYDLIDFFIEKNGAQVILIPHVLGSAEHFESDSVVSEEIYKSLAIKYKGKLSFARGNYDHHEIKYIIGQCDFFIGARMHSCIAALSQAVPAVGIAYSRKFYGVMDSIGFTELVADPRSMDREELFGVIERAFAQRQAIRSRLESVMVDVEKKVLNLFESIK
jgi:polysaccharide pyruvyl transferase WcaK-like protein